MAHVAACPQLRKVLPCMLMVLALGLAPTACSTSTRASGGGVHSAKANYTALELDQGKKWVVTRPMMAHMRNLEKQIQDFEAAPGRDHAVLANEIQENLGRFVTNCTMEGKAHDELHKWLMPFLGLSAEYAKATDPLVQQAKLREIKESLQVFHSYFE